MKRRTGIRGALVAILATLPLCVAARAQVEPAATGSSAMLDYDANYGQTAVFYTGYNTVQIRGIASGEAQYLNGSALTPFSLMYSGGYIMSVSGNESATGFFQHLAVSQGFALRHGFLSIRDDFGYYPQSPTTGFSGIPGAGGITGIPEPPSEPILALNTLRIDNKASATISHSLNYFTSFSMMGNVETLRFPNGGGLSLNQIGARPQVSWRVNALNSVSVQYAYTRFNYIGGTLVMRTQSLQPGLARVWSRRISTNVSAGPEWVQSNEPTQLPSSVGIACNASATYTLRSMSAAVFYIRSVTAGAGLEQQVGEHNNDVAADFSKSFGKHTQLGASGAYRQTQRFLLPGTINGAFGGVSVTRHLGEYFTVSGSYTVLHQSSSITLPAGAVQGISNEFGFNLAYHPRKTHIIRQ